MINKYLGEKKTKFIPRYIKSNKSEAKRQVSIISSVLLPPPCHFFFTVIGEIESITCSFLIMEITVKCFTS